MGTQLRTDIAHALGFTHNTPCAATLHTIFRCIDREAFEAKVGHGRRVWWRRRQRPPKHRRLPSRSMANPARLEEARAPETHLLSVVTHRTGLTLTQQAVAAKTNEITEVETVLDSLVLKSRIVTMDALLTQRRVAQTIVERRAIMS